jgi:hypothetical protein
MIARFIKYYSTELRNFYKLYSTLTHINCIMYKSTCIHAWTEGKDASHSKDVSNIWDARNNKAPTTLRTSGTQERQQQQEHKQL